MTFEALKAAGQAVPSQIAAPCNVARWRRTPSRCMNMPANRLVTADLHLHVQQRLIACFVFMGIGTCWMWARDGARPYQSMILALVRSSWHGAGVSDCSAMGLTPGRCASVAIIGGGGWPYGAIYLALVGKTTVRADYGGGGLLVTWG